MDNSGSREETGRSVKILQSFRGKVIEVPYVCVFVVVVIVVVFTS